MLKFGVGLLIGTATTITLLAYRFVLSEDEEWSDFVNQIDDIRSRRP